MSVVLSEFTPTRVPLEVPRMVVAHSGKQHAYRHAMSAHRIGALGHFVTSGYYKPDQLPDRLLASWVWLDKRLRRRTLNGLPSKKVIRRWRFELPELFARAVF